MSIRCKRGCGFVHDERDLCPTYQADMDELKREIADLKKQLEGIVQRGVKTWSGSHKFCEDIKCPDNTEISCPDCFKHWLRTGEVKKEGRG